MFKIIPTFLSVLLFSMHGYADECENVVSIESDQVNIYSDEDKNSNMYHIRVPDKYNGLELKLLVLTATKKTNEISIPLAIKSKGQQTGSYFHMSPDWLNILVTASYGKNLCTSLNSKLNI